MLLVLAKACADCSGERIAPFGVTMDDDAGVRTSSKWFRGNNADERSIGRVVIRLEMESNASISGFAPELSGIFSCKFLNDIYSVEAPEIF